MVMASPRWAVGKYDSYLPEDNRTDDEIEADAAERREEQGYRARHAVRLAREAAEAEARYAAHRERILARRKA